MKTNTAPTTLAKFITQSHLSPKLIRAVVRQMGGWETFMERAHDISSHGIGGGFYGFIYYTDTHAFAKRNRAEIAKLASEQASEFGQGVIEMVQSFNCFRHSKPTQEEVGTALYAGKDDGAGVLNALAWYAGEEVARSYTDLCELD